ncbi:MAG: nucleoside phosphorylase [Bacteroidaceae bacterium]|nr:nucleoside phosphorylase [Bacteroidaceae bacterium]
MTSKNHVYPESELIINSDGSIYHLHVRPEQLAQKIILVGDPNRVDLVAEYLENTECRISNREFTTVTGTYKGKRISVISTGIGCDNIDIVVNEIDALANIDFKTRTDKAQKTVLDMVRIGTCGGLQTFTPTGTFIASEYSIGFDGLLNFYAGRNDACELDFEEAFTTHMHWNKELLCAPYVIKASPELTQRIAEEDMVKGVTIACGGFYGPQGRQLRIPLADPDQNKKVESFEYQGHVITNFEMESSALAGLARLLGHHATTCCMVVANRRAHNVCTDYKKQMSKLIETVLERI